MRQTGNVAQSKGDQLLVDSQLWFQAKVNARAVDLINPNYRQFVLTVAQTVSAHKYPPFVYQLVHFFQSVHLLLPHLILAQHNTRIKPDITEHIWFVYLYLLHKNNSIVLVYNQTVALFWVVNLLSPTELQTKNIQNRLSYCDIFRIQLLALFKYFPDELYLRGLIIEWRRKGFLKETLLFFIAFVFLTNIAWN